VAERPEDIDVARAEAARKRAEARIAQQKSEVDYERARAALMKSLMRLQVQSRSQLAGRVGRQRMPPPQA
jgi:F-type H+-transporting ATPase subunit epsilon